MKLLVAGGRDFKNKSLLTKWLNVYFRKYKYDLEIVHGGARGADSLADEWAKERGLVPTVFPAQWNVHGRKAGFVRNAEMWNYAKMGIIFWDGVSKGTGHSLVLSSMQEKFLQVVYYPPVSPTP